ncbi:SDR family NAD(P)-dependent oxidoreductase [Nocardia sp. 348MFTsu5.1]|uniref:SDR family NAD(P)-dependent oxidoreductase n=1 Tax=Nocardia sp. 348MFTsu5.1 TaxID=1172185 RepID=UPI00036D96A3|nr:SDR family NAD(P)-dependent oxidoreductase [Nocardia sp. 348MFTsu5.1]
MSANFEGKVVLISGAGGTKGLALTQLLVSAGAKVFVTDMDASKLDHVAEQTEHPENVTHWKLDVGEEGDWIRVVDKIKQSEGKIDVLINSSRQFGVGKVADLTIEDWRRCTAANLDGTFLGAKTVLPVMIEGGRGGSIVNVISIASVRPTDNTPNYSATNAAAMNLLKTIAIQYAEHGIRANAVIAGFSANSPLEDTHGLAKRVIPLGRPGNGTDMANAILWLASDESSYVTGTGITVDGGWTLGLNL